MLGKYAKLGHAAASLYLVDNKNRSDWLYWSLTGGFRWRCWGCFSPVVVLKAKRDKDEHSPVPAGGNGRPSPWERRSPPSSLWILCPQSWSCRSTNHILRPLHNLRSGQCNAVLWYHWHCSSIAHANKSQHIIITMYLCSLALASLEQLESASNETGLEFRILLALGWGPIFQKCEMLRFKCTWRSWPFCTAEAKRTS